MSSKPKIVVSFAEKVGIMDVDYMADTVYRMKAQRSVIFYQNRPHDNVITLAREKDVELIASSDPHLEIKQINKRFSKDTYEVIIKNLEDLRATMMDVG